MSQANHELYARERFKFGDRAREIAEFEGHAQRVRDAQATLAQRHVQGNPQRVFHAKIHACLAGTLRLIDDRPERTRHGIFGTNAKEAYRVIGRFSSGVGFEQHDLKPDVRGLALKVFGAQDAASAGDAHRSVDFLMTNSTNPFGADQEEFVQFMEANVDSGVLGARLVAFLVGHPAIARLLVNATLRVVPSLAMEQYWSGHPYLLGPHQAMKFNVRPASDEQLATGHDLRDEAAHFQTAADDALESRIERWFALQRSGAFKMDPNYLRHELQDRLQRGPLRFLFSVQLEKDEETTPIENALIEWKERDSPSIPVAVLTFDRAIDSSVCERLRFTPRHYVPDHRPLGNLGRGRIFTYEASQSGRHARTDEPKEEELFPAA
jgi:hypothetical protein